MWNVSESTIKRWADASGLHCSRTPGGHRRFHLQDLCEFQEKQAFEATGLLTAEQWEDPDLEVWLNARKFEKLGQLLSYLVLQNQRRECQHLLERIYLRGISLAETFDRILLPLLKEIRQASQDGSILRGQARLAEQNLEESLLRLSSKMIRRRRNDCTALCASPAKECRIPVSVLGGILEAEGWDVLNIGDRASFEIMSEIVESEPVRLVCLYSKGKLGKKIRAGTERLNGLVRSYRIPLLLTAPRGEKDSPGDLSVEARFQKATALHQHLKKYR